MTLMFWIDMETTGLDESGLDVPIEIGMVVTDHFGRLMGSGKWLIKDEMCQPRIKEVRSAPDGSRDQFVRDMHRGSGLWDDQAGKTGLTTPIDLHSAELDMIEFLREHLDEYDGEGKPPLVGSSVGFDQGFLEYWFPKVYDLFHYRVIDVSTLKELCKILNPGLYARIGESTMNRKSHRVLEDLEDSVSEYMFYVDNFLFVGDEVI